MTHFAYQNHALYVEDVSLADLAAAYGTPLYVYSRSDIDERYRAYAEGLSGLDVKICYAMKANSALGILNTLVKAGSGIDVVSAGEIAIALRGGARPSDIVFSGVGKTPDEMAYALEIGIFQFNVESNEELEVLNAVAGRLRMQAPVALRINPDVDPLTHAKISTGTKETKFGISMDDAMASYRRANDLPHIHVKGISVHIGSQLTSLEPYREAYTRLRDFIALLQADHGITLQVINLGGGLGIAYREDIPPTAQAYGALVTEIFAGFAGTIVIEPGRSLVGPAGVLLTKVLYVKQGHERTHVIVDAGLTELIRPAMYDAWHTCQPVRQPAPDAVPQPVDLVGPVCETGDIFAKDRPMVVPAAADLLVFRDAGAYGMAMGSTYNARPLVAEVLVAGSAHRLIRRRQTIDDLMAGQNVPNWD